ncbi:patatin-like phospholipase family protein [Collimonas pratensis]|uniref:Patatin-like phospholipase family protein n=1 Tax=Collimonas pratensis TaxID=279113 RepID=A0ABN4MET1_9BURK|nr:patatin-like phospholipase family protein [Collimonas pratensis]AMP16070.1 patatin-like phospholipase family protein [Collimonas pratensis]
METKQKTGLILTGGGARAAYQIGVMDAVASILREHGWAPEQNPFNIICGTSAGAINATALACRVDNFGLGVQKLKDVWEHFTVEQVYRADSLGVLRSGARWLSLLSFGWLLRKWHAHPPNSLLDNTPLITLLHRLLDLDRLDKALADGSLDALAITASSYSGGQHITFYQSAIEIQGWTRSQRRAVRDQIGVGHLLASSAIPFIFPAIPIFCEGRRQFFGDGSMRQLAPISPAIHLGASKVMVVGAGRRQEAPTDSPTFARYPSLAQIASHALSSIFLDGLAVDIERLERINHTLSFLTEEQRERTPLKPVEMLIISPSEQIDDIATKHFGSLPVPIRTLLGGLGAKDVQGGGLASYLLFESGYTRELIRMGQKDTLARRDEVAAFFGPADSAVTAVGERAA